MITGIYGIRHKISNRWYVGQAYDIRKRFKDHRAFASTKTRKHLYLAFRKYGFSAFAWRILERCEKPELNRRERFWIQKLNSVEPNGFNLTTGGDRDWQPSESLRRKLSLASLGRKQTPETIRKRAEKNIGQRRTLATRRKMRKAQLGKKASEATRRKLAWITRKRFRRPEIRKWNRERMLKQWRNRDYRRRQKKAHQGYKPTAEQLRKFSRSMRKVWRNPRFKAMMSKKMRGRKLPKYIVRIIARKNRGKKRTEKWKKDQSKRVKKIWLRPEVRRRVIKALTGLIVTGRQIGRAHV